MDIKNVLTAHGLLGGSDTVPPAKAVIMTATVTSDSVTVYWCEPIDAEFEGVRIVRKIGGYPTSITDGTHIYSGRGTYNELGNHIDGYYEGTRTFTDTNLQPETTYYYRLFAYDKSGVFNKAELNQTTYITTKPQYVCYGFRVDESVSNPSQAVTYIEDNVDFIPATNTNVGNFNGGSWLDKFPFKDVKPIARPSTTVLQTNDIDVNPNDFSTGVNGESITDDYDTFIKIPPIYWKFTRISDSIYEVRISDGEYDEGFKALAHSRADVLKGSLYIGAYEASWLNTDNTLHSFIGKNPTMSTSLNDLRQFAYNRGKATSGNGYTLMTFHTWTLLQILFVLMFKSLDSQNSLGNGVVNSSAGIKATGISGKEGMYYGSTSSTSYPVKFMGIENLWGNLFSYLDGAIFDMTNGILKVNKNDIFNDDGSNYPIVSNIGKFVDDRSQKDAYATMEAGFQAKTNASGGSSTMYYCDTYNRNGVLFYVGGYYGTGSGAAGIFCQDSTSAINSTSGAVGARLQWLAP